MLDGRYPSEEFGELRPRIVWDRVAGTIRARKGARALAITNAGTIPDRGLFSRQPARTAAASASSTRRWSTRRARARCSCSARRRGGSRRSRATAWSSRRRRACRARCRSGRATRVGRPRELGEAIGAFARWAVEQEPSVLERDYDLDPLAARNLVDYLREQEAATRVVPSDRTIVIERFRDEIGDWRLCVLSPYGGRVHAAWGLALSAKIRDEYGLESDAIWSDDGIIVHLPDADEPPGRRAGADRPRRARGPRGRRARRLGAVRRALPRERRPRAADPARVPGPPHAAVAAAAEVADAAGGRQALRAVPDRARDLPRVPARRARPARPAGAARASCTGASSRWSRSRRRPPRRSRPRCCSTTSRRTCTRATRRTPSGARRRWRSTASCCASCSARRSCAS